MGKKIISLLLALLLVCATAAAEGAYEITLKWQPAFDGTRLCLQRTTDNSDAKLDQLAQAMVDVAEKSSIQLNIQDNGLYMAVTLVDTLLVDMGIFSREADTVMVTSLLPDRYLSFDEPMDAVLTRPDKWVSLDGTDEAALSMDVLQALMDWAETIESSEESGNFVGDAYEGGTRRRSFTFDDADIAVLLNALLDVMDKHGLDDRALEPVTSSAPLSTLRGKNNEVAEANRFSYNLHLVTDDWGNFVGLSLLALEGENQVATLSFAVADNGIRLVLGYGMNGQNYYIDGVFIDDGTTEDAFAAAYSLTVFQDPYRLGFSAVEEYMDYVELLISGTLKVQPGAEKTTWLAETEVINPASPIGESRYVLEGEHAHAAQTADQKLHWYLLNDAGEPVLAETLSLQMIPCEPMSIQTDALAMVPAEGEGSLGTEEMEALMEESLQNVTVELFRKIPAPLLTFLMY